MGCHVDQRFAAEIDAARGCKSRSDFLREAIYEYLCCQGKRLPESFKHAPDRAGKGGRPRKNPDTKNVMMNDEQNEQPAPPMKPVTYEKGSRKKPTKKDTR